ncbi:MAG: hypothetical protein CVU56_24905 [Deltaproteobacteria bacterium HGW-Deltaproteobacteria-14]|nr:MAG: hypothetical protein CVU56_24905 [Deltaproteobacteria bacterium HGW-Deltaproteobacteria-14]
MDAAALASPVWEGCLDGLAARLAERPTIRAITVAARIPEQDRGGFDPLVLAEIVAKRLGATLGATRVSAVAPRPRVGEPASIQIVYVERRAQRPVAQLVFAGGGVRTGYDANALAPARVGQLLGASELLRTEPGGVAVVRLADGSQLWVAPGSLIRVLRAVGDRGAERTVRIELFEGNAEVVAKPAAGTFDVVTPAAIAGVRGTEFRVVVVPASSPDAPTAAAPGAAPRRVDGSRVETLGGGVALASDGGEVRVSGGKGSRAATGGVPEPPRDLLTAPRPLTALHGPLASGEALSWQAVAGAARYEVLLARDAAFTDQLRILVARGERTVLPADLARGRWFWRVRAVDPDGFVGFPSKIYAFAR